jgi:hypothetical protein
MAHSNYTASFGNSGRQAYGSDRSSLAPRTLQHSAQFGRSLVTHISTWIGVSIVAWGLLPPDVQQMLTGKSWPSSIDEKWPFLLGAALLTWSCFRAWSGQSALAEQVTDSPCLELQLHRIDIGSLPCGCELVAHIEVCNHGSDSQATNWQLRGSDDKGISLTTNDAIQVRFEPMGGDLTDHPVSRSQTRRGVVTFIAQGITDQQARQITHWSLACRDGLNECHESDAQYL